MRCSQGGYGTPGSSNDAPVIVKKSGVVSVNYNPGDLVTFKHGYTSGALNGIIKYGMTGQQTLSNASYNACTTTGEPFLRTVGGEDKTIANGTLYFAFMDDQGNYTDVNGNLVTATQMASSNNPNAACYFATGTNPLGSSTSSVFSWQTCPTTSTSMNTGTCTSAGY